MTRSEILSKVNEIFHDVFDDETLVIEDTTTAADIQDWDSLTHILLINAVENAFGCKFRMKNVLGMINVGEMLDILEKLV